MNPRAGMREVAFFCLRFVAIAAPCMIVWWRFLLVDYLLLIGQFAGSILNVIQAPPIDNLTVTTNPDSILNTDVLLVFHVAGETEAIPYAPMVNSSPPFIALVLATGGLGLVRRVAILLIGSAIMFLGQGIFLIGHYYFIDQFASAKEIPVAFGQFCITAPFILWIAMAYWDRIGKMLGNGGDSDRGPRP
ncbi:MAG: hypothetical protein QGG73_09170 [Candidatus Hydrogenedentes bacterium]|nr:hypothetical protein [Candidatus Hydrogenedentota bacterium]